jgi:hypothetical protein
MIREIIAYHFQLSTIIEQARIDWKKTVNAKIKRLNASTQLLNKALKKLFSVSTTTTATSRRKYLKFFNEPVF